MKTRSTNKRPEKRLKAVLANVDSDMAAVVAAIVAERRAEHAHRHHRPSGARRQPAHAA